MKDKIDKVKANFQTDLKNVTNSEILEELRLKYFSRNGLFADLFEEFKTLSKEEKPKYGKVLNIEKQNAQKSFDELKSKLEKGTKDNKSYIDLTILVLRLLS